MEMIRKKGWRVAGFVAIALLFTSGIALGQAYTGAIYARALDDQGLALPGVSVTLTGVSAPLTQVTNVNGEVRFVNLAPTTYTLEFNLKGFAKVTRKNVTVAVGVNTELNVTMKLSAVQESVVVTGESPLLDTRRTGSTSTVNQVELNSVPTARDPWVVLQTAPGVQIDRVNVGGSESGQQSQYIGKGSGTTQGTWNFDGVAITDMAATGGSAIYFDFDSMAEINMALGGADVSIASPGVQLNVVTKRGTNDVHGSARAYYETKNWSSSNTPPELLTQPTAPGSGNAVDQYQDYGIEMGGPVAKDILWLWGSYGRQQIDLRTASNLSDKTSLLDWGFKLNANVVPENTFTAAYTYADKQKFGRNASATRPAETAWNQSGPTKIYKIEDSHVFGANMFATASYSRVVGGFDLITPGQTQRYQDASGVYHYSYLNQIIRRPQTQVNFTPSFFFRTGEVGHEIKAGFVYKTSPWSTEQIVPTGIVSLSGANYGLDKDLAGFVRPYFSQTELHSYSGYLSDTMTVGRLTASVGVRYDYQWGRQPQTTVSCCAFSSTTWPQVPLKPLVAPATEPLIWDDFQPRVGLTYALGSDSKTLLKASYARFVNMMGGNSSPLGVNAAGAAGVTYLYYYWTDPGNHIVKPGAVDFASGPQIWYNWDPSCPNCVDTPVDKLDYGMKTPKTDEFILSAEREVLPAFVVGIAGTYRHMTDFYYGARLNADGTRVLTPADFTCTPSVPYPIPGGNGTASVNVCNPTNPGVWGNGRLYTNRPGYNQQYWGIDFSATKRYSDKWMARFNFTYSDWTQHGLEEGRVDPSNLQGGSEFEGGILAPSSTASGAKGQVFTNSRWQTTLSGMYTFPYDFNLSTSVYMREGYPVAYYRTVAVTNRPGTASLNYQLGDMNTTRLNTVLEWDLGVSKVVKVGPLSVALQLDAFNLLNRNTVLQRQARVRSTLTTADARDNNIIENQSPRIFRVGARISF